jgi:hypothetical protein
MNLDILEARHQLDNIVCYSGLKDTTFDDLQKGLSLRSTLQNRPPLIQLSLGISGGRGNNDEFVRHSNAQDT